MSYLWKMAHPDHGAKLIYSEHEISQYEAQGWSLYRKPQAEVVPSPVADEVVDYAAPKRRGRPPKVKQDGDSADAD